MNSEISKKLFPIEQPKFLELRNSVRSPDGREKNRRVFYAADGVTLLLFVEERDVR